MEQRRKDTSIYWEILPTKTKKISLLNNDVLKYTGNLYLTIKWQQKYPLRSKRKQRKKHMKGKSKVAKPSPPLSLALYLCPCRVAAPIRATPHSTLFLESLSGPWSGMIATASSVKVGDYTVYKQGRVGKRGRKMEKEELGNVLIRLLSKNNHTLPNPCYRTRQNNSYLVPLAHKVYYLLELITF